VAGKKMHVFTVVEICGDADTAGWEKVLYSCRTVTTAEKWARRKRRELKKAGKDPERILVRME
jgi:hypothetical protein